MIVADRRLIIYSVRSLCMSLCLSVHLL